ncbi:MAG: LysM peptidoglycan-binding domain-containing protein [Anaerolineae bacterium]|nr:LysM peptidoglycan-binding domain-containing protein [Anaerolineae bacterium]
MHRKSLVLFFLLACWTTVAFAQEDTNDSSLLPITADVIYEVRPSDTLETIGALFDVSPHCIADQNDLTLPTTLQIGQSLLISVSCPRYGEDPRDEGTGTVRFPRDVVTYEDDCEGYRVRVNDSLETIGFALDISVVSLQLANDSVNPQNLIVNTCLTIPEDAPPYGVFPALTDARGSDGQGGGAGETYIFQPGDTLDVIAQEYDVSVVSLQLANSITNPQLVQPGTLIVIPANAPAYGVFPAVSYPVNGEIYVVQQGDTLETIAQDFDISVVALRAANGVRSGTVVGLGTALLIPTDVPAYGTDGEFDLEGLGIGGGSLLHVVQPGETLDVIAASYDVDTRCLASGNGVDRPPLLQPGTVLLVDSSCDPYTGEGIPALGDSISPAGDTEAQPLGG